MKKLSFILIAFALLTNVFFTSCGDDSTDPLTDEEPSNVEKNENKQEETPSDNTTSIEYLKLWAPADSETMKGAMFMDMSNSDATSCFIGLYKGSPILYVINIENPLYTQEAFGSTRVTIKGTLKVKSQNKIVESKSGYFYTTNANQIYYTISQDFATNFLQYLIDDKMTSVTITLEAPLGNQTLSFIPRIK